jgi:hypothetical protein
MFPHRARPILTLLLLSVFALAGCSDDDIPTVPNPVTSQTDADDVAFLAGMSFDNVNTVLQSGDLGAAPAPVDAVVFSDTTLTRGNVTFQLSRRYFTAAHVEQTVPDASTDSVVVGSRAFGTDSTSSARYRVTVGHAGQLRVGGLIASRPILTLEGAWADTLDARFTALPAGGDAHVLRPGPHRGERSPCAQEQHDGLSDGGPGRVDRPCRAHAQRRSRRRREDPRRGGDAHVQRDALPGPDRERDLVVHARRRHGRGFRGRKRLVRLLVSVPRGT